MIGYYVHHHGSGHRHRATAVARALVAQGEDVTGLSSLPRPDGWPGDWVDLALDADGTEGAGQVASATAGGRLHWVPTGHPGLRARTASISAWIDRVSPAVVVVDVSVEVALLVRLHGVPVVTLVQPGHRGDPAHRLGYDVADALVGCWPAEAGRTAGGMLRGVPAELAARVEPVGALSRFAPVTSGLPRPPGPRRVVLLSGTGGDTGPTRAQVDAARAETPDWQWTVLDRALGSWVADPSVALRDADVVVTHAGQNAVAEVAAARTPAVVVAQPRPHDEQDVTAAVLAAGPWPVVGGGWPGTGTWSGRLEAAAALDGTAWGSWCDGAAADRFAATVRRTARPEPVSPEPAGVPA